MKFKEVVSTRNDRFRRVLICDLAGEALDFTLLTVHHKKMKVLATNEKASPDDEDIEFSSPIALNKVSLITALGYH